MKYFLTALLCAGTLSIAAPTASFAANGVIKRACVASDRAAATPKRCGCIQRVANDALTRSDRRTVAKWFADPHKAQELKMSQTASDDALWERYEAFGQLVQAICK